MDKKKLKHYHEKLLEKKRQLTGVVESTEGYEREADQEVSQDPADIASNAYTKDLLFSQSTTERNILKLVHEALTRMDAGGYGVCVHCEEDIQEKRLEAVPWARHCIVCQDLQERGLLEEDRE